MKFNDSKDLANVPDVIRVAPVPLYNSFLDVWNLVNILRNIIKKT